MAIDLEVFIEMQDWGTITPTYGTGILEVTTYLDSSMYDGATYYFEIVGINSNASDATITLVDSAETSETTVTLPASTASPTLIRSSSFTPGTVNKQKRWKTSISNGDVTIYTSRIIVVQSGSTKTELQIALGTQSSAKVSAYANPSNWGNTKRKFWYYDSSKFATSGSITVEMEGLAKTNSKTATCYIGIKTAGSTSAVSNGESTHYGSAIVYSRNSGGITLSNGTEYEGDFYCTDSKTASVYAVRLIIRLSATVSKVETVIRCGWEIGLAATEDDERRYLWTEGYSGTPTIYYESTGSCTASGDDVDLQDHGTNDSGTTGDSQVTGSDIDYGGSTLDRHRTSSISLTNGNRFYASSLNAATLNVCNAWIIVQVDSGAAPPAVVVVPGHWNVQMRSKRGARSRMGFGSEPKLGL